MLPDRDRVTAPGEGRDGNKQQTLGFMGGTARNAIDADVLQLQQEDLT